MVDMKRKPEKEEMPGEVEMDEPRYPYGLCIRLEKEDMEKLGITALPAVGSEMTINAKAVVSQISSYETQGSDADMSFSLQITDMALDGAKSAETKTKEMYPSMLG